MRSKDRCFVCRGKDKTPLLHLDLSLVEGGVDLCKACEKFVSDTVKDMTNLSGRARLHGLQVGLHLQKEEKHAE